MPEFFKQFSTKKSSLAHFSMWVLVLLHNPILYKTISLAELGMSSFLITIAAITGFSILRQSNTLTDHFILWPISILLGSLIIGSCILFLPSPLVIPALLLITAGSFAILLFVQNKADKTSSEPLFPVIWLLPAFIIILIHQFAGTDYIEAQLLLPFQGKDALPDSFFFTLVTESFAQYGHSNSLFDFGANFSYQPFAFYPPAALTAFSGIPAQISLWGIWMPFYKIAGPFIICYGIIKHFNSNKRHVGGLFLLSILLFYSLAPINPKYLLSFELDKIVWLGTGYLLPGGNPPFSAALLIGGIVMYIFFSKAKYNTVDQGLMVLLIAIIINTKTAFYIPFGIFLGTIAIFKYFVNIDKQRLLLLLISIIPALLIYLFPFKSSENSLVQFSLAPGYYLGYFMKLTSASSFGKALVYMIGTLTLWGGIRFLIMLVGLKQNLKKTGPFILAALISLIACIFLPSLLSLKLIAPNGELLQNLTFDLVQFVRGAYFITTIATLIVIFSQWGNYFSKKWIVTTLVFLGIIVVGSNASRFMNADVTEEDQTWRNEVRHELNSIQQTGLFAIKGNRKYSGQLLAAEGIGPWWFTTKRGDGSGYIMNNTNYYRSVAVDSLFSGNNPSEIIELMKIENVQLIVATPITKNKLEELKNNKFLKQSNANYWIYNLK